MVESTRVRVPSCRLHKLTGQAVVMLCGRDCYLGKHGSVASKAESDLLVGEWQANGRQLPAGGGAIIIISVNELIVGYWQFVETYYVENGRDSGEQRGIKVALRYPRQLYGRQPATAFGPIALKACHQAMIDAGMSRGVINQNVGRIKRLFKWGVENELVPPSIFHWLQAVVGLRRGRSAARETEHHGHEHLIGIGPKARGRDPPRQAVDEDGPWLGDDSRKR